MLPVIVRPLIFGLNKIVNVSLPSRLLRHSSKFVAQCNLSSSSERFSRSLEERSARVSAATEVVISDQPASEQGAGSVWIQVENLSQVWVELASIVRGGFAPSQVVLDLKNPFRPLTELFADLGTGPKIVPKPYRSMYYWEDSSLRDGYLLEIDKALRILRNRGSRIQSSLEIEEPSPVLHRNRLLNSTPSIAPIPDHKAEIETYCTDYPGFAGYNPSYPERISYTFNGRGFRNDFEHDVNETHSVAIGCSFVEGVGVPSDATLSHQLGLAEQRKVFCLGSHGGSNSYMYRSFLNHLAQKPRGLVNVYAVFTEIHRIDARDWGFLYSNGIHTTFSAWSDPYTMRFIQQVGVGYPLLSAYMTYVFLKEHCASNGLGFSAAFYGYWNPSPRYHAHVFGENVESRLWGCKFADVGRDRLHPGRIELARLARQLVANRTGGGAHA
jgi:hypothetical protein